MSADPRIEPSFTPAAGAGSDQGTAQLFKVVVVTFDSEATGRISAALDGVATTASVEPQGNLASTIVDTMGADLVVVDSDATGSHGENLLDLIRSMKERYPDLPAVALGDESAAQRVLAAMRSGAVDFLERDSTQEEFRAQIGQHLKRYRPSEVRMAAKVRAVVSARGNEGEAVFALNLAALAAKKAGERASILLDFALPSGEIEIGLGVTSTYTVRDAIVDMPRLDRTLIASAVARDERSGMYLLPLTAAGENVRDMNGAAILSLIGLLRPMFQEIVINGGALTRGGGLQQLLPLVDDPYLVVRQDLASVKAASDLIRRANLDDEARLNITLVIPEADKSIALSPDEIADTLALKKVIQLPPARADVTNALNAGIPLAVSTPSSGYVRAIGKSLGSTGSVMIGGSGGGTKASPIEELTGKVKAGLDGLMDRFK